MDIGCAGFKSLQFLQMNFGGASVRALEVYKWILPLQL